MNCFHPWTGETYTPQTFAKSPSRALWNLDPIYTEPGQTDNHSSRIPASRHTRGWQRSVIAPVCPNDWCGIVRCIGTRSLRNQTSSGMMLPWENPNSDSTIFFSHGSECRYEFEIALRLSIRTNQSQRPPLDCGFPHIHNAKIGRARRSARQITEQAGDRTATHITQK